MSKNIVNVPELIDQQKVSLFQVTVLLLCAAVVLMDGFDAQALGYVAPVLAKAWKIRPSDLKDVFAASLFGLMLGALFLAPLADRLGRKVIIIGSTLVFSACTLLTLTSDSVTSLLIWRFLTGLGLGGAMPNGIAMMSDYSPQKRRAQMVMIMFTGFSLGAALGGFFAAWLIPHLGWKGVFWVGGLLPLVLAPVLVVALPESIRLLAVRGAEDDRIRGLLKRINPNLSFAPGTRFTALEERHSGLAVRGLFLEGRSIGTCLLWMMFFMNLLNIYFLSSWLPTVINSAGISVQKAAIITALFQIGGCVATVSLGSLFDRLSPFLVLTLGYLCASFFIAFIGFCSSSAGLLVPVVFFAGFFIVGAQGGANALAAAFYPTALRSTGVGWALGIGRIGSIVGPWVGGLILSFEWKTSSLFLTAAAPALLSTAAAFIMAMRHPKLKAHGAANGEAEAG